MFSCEFCGKDDDFVDSIKCGACHREYCHECWYDVFIHEHTRNCIFCAKKRIYKICSKCNNNFDLIDIKKQCTKCHRYLCSTCSNDEQHGRGIC